MYNIHDSKALTMALEKLGVSKFRHEQEAPLMAILNGKDVLVNMPTGGGKSLLYQAPAVMREKQITLVISPLKALQYDQVEALAKKGIRAAVLNSDLNNAEYHKTVGLAVMFGGLLYLAPEQLRNPWLRMAMEYSGVSCIAVDEAHVLAQSQGDFRTAYGEIGEFINALPHRPQVLALTATATVADCKTIIESLDMRMPEVFKSPMCRDNLKLFIKVIETTAKDNKRHNLEMNRFHSVERELAAWDGKGAAIVYCNTVQMVKNLYKWLKARDYPVCKFHGKLNRNKRKKSQEQFMSGNRPIVVATNAFGLGIDKPDVRLVIHAGLPLSMDGYVQEIGRAGRDGKKSRCVLFYAKSDFTVNERTLKHNSSAETKGLKLKRLQALRELIVSDKCLWCGIEKYFGQKKDKSCGHCCKCLYNNRRKRK